MNIVVYFFVLAWAHAAATEECGIDGLYPDDEFYAALSRIGGMHSASCPGQRLVGCWRIMRCPSDGFYLSPWEPLDPAPASEPLYNPPLPEIRRIYKRLEDGTMEPLEMYWPGFPQRDEVGTHADKADVIDDAENEETANPDPEWFTTVEYGRKIGEEPDTGFAFKGVILTRWGETAGDDDLDDDETEDDDLDDMESGDGGISREGLHELHMREAFRDLENQRMNTPRNAWSHRTRYEYNDYDLTFTVFDDAHLHQDDFPPYEISFAPKERVQIEPTFHVEGGPAPYEMAKISPDAPSGEVLQDTHPLPCQQYEVPESDVIRLPRYR